jgi:serine/threonine-protein kinase
MRDDDDPEIGDRDESFLSIAGRIADGEDVDWEAEASRAPEATRSLVDALKDIAVVGAAHLSVQDSMAAESGGDSTVTGGPAMWRHLTLLETVGQGRFGTVYRAFDTQLQIDVALKLSHPGTDSLDTASAIQEARLLAKVRHPNVVRVYGADTEQGRVGIWMDLVRGRTLADVVKNGPLRARDATSIGIQLCDALAAVHAEQILHGDLKAHNVMRRDDGSVVLLDFGAGRRLDAALPVRDLAGTLVYMAPEVLSGEPRSPRSDIYSLGVILFHLVTGGYPVWADSVEGARAKHERGPTRLTTHSRLPSRFVRAVQRALSANPRDRYASAAEFKSDLERVFGEAPWLRLVMAVAAVLVIGVAALWLMRPVGPTPIATAGPSGPPLPIAPVTFDIEAAFYRVNDPAREQRLSAGDSIRVKDQLSLAVKTTAPAYVYVVNEDEQGEQLLLFPLTGPRLGSPLPADQEVRLPSGYNWEVSSAGGREHFLVFASREPLTAFAGVFDAMQSPREGATERSSRIPKSVVKELQLRAVGGLQPRIPEPATSTREVTLSNLFKLPLAGKEKVEGMWVRQLTLNNAGSAATATGKD